MSCKGFVEKTVIITGASSGIGKSIAMEFSREGANLVLGYYTHPIPDEIIKNAESEGVKAIPVKVDVRKKSDCEMMVSTAVDMFDRLDIAINNAGVSTMNRVVDLTEEEWDYNMDVNAKGVFFCCQAEVKQFLKQGNGGKIVNIASIAGKRPAPLLAHYNASKFAVLGFTKSLALEVAADGINVNAVCPGLVKTPMQEREIKWECKIRGITREKVIEEYLSLIPLGRLEEPEDVARVVLFLASDDASYITGQAINVAGGMEMAI